MLAAVVPPAHDATHVEPALPCVLAVDIGDLELPARRRLQVFNDVEHVRRVTVEPDDCVIRRRCVVPRVDDARLLDDVRDPPVAVVGDDTERLRVGHLLDEHERAVLPGADRIRLRVLEDVVAQADDEPVAGAEVARHPDDLRDSTRLDLHLVREVEVEEQLVASARAYAPVAE